MPKGAVKGGHTIQGEDLYICRLLQIFYKGFVNSLNSSPFNLSTNRQKKGSVISPRVDGNQLTCSLFPQYHNMDGNRLICRIMAYNFAQGHNGWEPSYREGEPKAPGLLPPPQWARGDVADHVVSPPTR